jgi:hypothetical protein
MARDLRKMTAARLSPQSSVIAPMAKFARARQIFDANAA